jgi:DNA-binding transcriptional LysR family regulator
MELQQLRCFVAVAEELHFGRAARRLELLPSALGRHIRLLEEDLSTRLLARTTRSVALTDDGAALLEEARLLLAKTFKEIPRAWPAAGDNNAPGGRHRYCGSGIDANAAS